MGRRAARLLRVDQERVLDVVGFDERAEHEVGLLLLAASTSGTMKEHPSTCDGLKWSDLNCEIGCAGGMKEASARDGRSNYSPEPTHACLSSARWLSAQWAGKEGGAERGGSQRGGSVTYDHTLAVAGVGDVASRCADRRSVD